MIANKMSFRAILFAGELNIMDSPSTKWLIWADELERFRQQESKLTVLGTVSYHFAECQPLTLSFGDGGRMVDANSAVR